MANGSDRPTWIPRRKRTSDPAKSLNGFLRGALSVAFSAAVAGSASWALTAYRVERLEAAASANVLAHDRMQEVILDCKGDLRATDRETKQYRKDIERRLSLLDQ